MSAPDDEYPTCVSTYATLRFYHKTEPPDKVTALLEVEPSKTMMAGPAPLKSRRSYPLSGWFLESKGACRVTGRAETCGLAYRSDYECGVANCSPLRSRLEGRCVLLLAWDRSRGTDAGSAQMKHLARLGLICGFDVYFDNRDEPEEPA